MRTCQKAPSAIRCIKTRPGLKLGDQLVEGQKAPSAIRCIKTVSTVIFEQSRMAMSEST